MDHNNIDQHPAMQTLVKGLRREYFLKLWLFVGLSAFGMLFLYAFFAHSIILSIFGLICAVLGLRFLFRLLRQDATEDSRLLHLLRHQPKQIVWVYSVVTERLPFGFQVARYGTMYFKLIDGDDIAVSLPIPQLKVVSKFLNRLLPHATFGYTKDREQWYIASPNMLLRDERGRDGELKW